MWPLALACTDPPIALDQEDSVERVPGVPDDTAADTTTEDDTEPTPEALFSLDDIHVVRLSLTSEAFDALTSELYAWQSAELVIDGSEFPNVGVRIKGRLGSLRYPPSKSAFKVDFLEMGATDTLGGLEKLSLNNMVQDCAKTHELAAYGIHRLVGLPAPRVGYAHVYVNDEDYGLYSLVEDYDDEFLKANFADPTGNLYDGDYHLWPDGSYTLVDFNGDTQPHFELDEGEDVGLADIQAVTAALDATGAGQLQATVGPLVDLDQHAAFVAVAAWTGHADSYTYYSNNYRVYFDPGRGGRAVFFPWDPDWAFYSATNVWGPYGRLSAQCLADTTCRAAVDAWIDTLSARVPGSELQAEVEDAFVLTERALREDPKLESSLREIRVCQEDQIGWFSRRGAELAGWPL